MRREISTAATIPFIAIVSACGGGGDVASIRIASIPPPVALPSIPTPVTKPSSENFDTPEYQLSPTAVYSNAIGAWQAGATGRGIKIGIVDTGLNATLAEFAGRIDPASDDVAGNRPMEDLWGHGTGVASIAASARNDNLIVGIAYEASIVMLKADKPGSCPDACVYVQDDIAQGIDAARRAGARVINLSIGGDTNGEIREAVRRAAAAGIIIVIAAGNQSPYGAPTNFALELLAEAPGHVIVVGAVGQPSIDYSSVDYNQLNSYSSGAWAARNFYLAAPGGMVYLVDKNGILDRLQASSYAAPVVSGAVALLAQAFPMLSGQQIAQILFTTADDLGAPGIDEIYGWGRLNIGRSFQPIGSTRVAGSEVEVSVIANGVAPAVAGDALSRGSMKTVVLDDYQRPFDVNLGKTVQQAAMSMPLHGHLVRHSHSTAAQVGGFDVSMTVQDGMKGLSNDPLGPLSLTESEARRSRLIAASAIRRLGPKAAMAFGLSESSESLEERLSNAQPRAFMVTPEVTRDAGFSSRSAAAFAVRQDFGRAVTILRAERGDVVTGPDLHARGKFDLAGITVQRALGKGSVLLRASFLNESRTLLGGRLAPIFGPSGSRTVFLDLEGRQELGAGWTVSGEMRRGWTTFASGAFNLSGYSVGVTKAGLFSVNDLVALRFAQPLAVSEGGLALTMPSSWDYQTQTASVSLSSLSLAPRKRELASEIGYEWRLSGGMFGGNIFARVHPGHSSTSAPDLGGAVRMKLRF